MITIAGTKFPTTTPADLAAQIMAETGFGLAEIGALIDGGPALAAQALRPLLRDAPADIGGLATLIASDPDAPASIRALYAPAASATLDPSAPPTEESAHAGE